jgi:hypothetical protein
MKILFITLNIIFDLDSHIILFILYPSLGIHVGCVRGFGTFVVRGD